MSFDVLGQLNWLAVIVAAVVYFALGAIWYMPFVFGGPWQRGMGWNAEGQEGPGAVTYVAPALFALVSSIATALLANATGSTNIGTGLVLGLVVGVGYGLAIEAYNAVFDPTRPGGWTVWAVTGSYHLVALVLVAVIVSVWR